MAIFGWLLGFRLQTVSVLFSYFQRSLFTRDSTGAGLWLAAFRNWTSLARKAT
jgi:hypothetical protein